GGPFPGDEADVVAHELGVALWDAARACALDAAARAAGRVVPVHVKIDTGMTRLGLDVGAVAEFAPLVRDLPGLEGAPVFSPFAPADAVDPAPAPPPPARFEAPAAPPAAAGGPPPRPPPPPDAA